MSTPPTKVRVDLTLAQRLQLLVQMNGRETGAEAAMRIRRIARCCGLARKTAVGGDYFEPMDPGEARRTGFEVAYVVNKETGEKTDRVRGVDITKESGDRAVRCAFTEPDHKWIVDKIGEYDIPGSVEGWVGSLDAFGLLHDDTLEGCEGPEAIDEEKSPG